MLKEMQLIVTLVLCSYLSLSRSDSPQPEWRQSRFIIDNRRNSLFSHKPLTPLFRHPSEPSTPTKYPIPNETFRRKLFPVERFQKDLSAEASIAEPNYYEKYNENSLRKLVKPYEELQYRGKNSPGPQFIPTEQNDVEDSRIATSTENQRDEDVDWSTKVESPRDDRENWRESPTTQSFPWRIEKTEEGNGINKNLGGVDGKEKHVYETRIETVSYHQEVIFNPTKVEASTQKENWYQTQQPQETRSVHVEEPERDYEEPEKNYEEAEKNYEEPERNYEEPERNYEEPEGNYEEPERNYEEPERNYEEPEKNYEVDESVSVMSEGRVHEPENEDNKNKFGYVVEGKNYRKYRVEERTPDGFIVGEYGVVSHDDGSLRGVRYTADGTTNPQLIYETLIKFLSL